MATLRTSKAHTARGDQTRQLASASVLGVLLICLQVSHQVEPVGAGFPADLAAKEASDFARDNAVPGTELAIDADPRGLSRARSDAIIVDDLDRFIQPNCVVEPCPGYGFNRYGPATNWRPINSSSDVVWNGHAWWTGGTSDSEASVNSAYWGTNDLRGDDLGDRIWQVLAFVPRTNTGRPTTRKARYCVGTTKEQSFMSLSSSNRGCPEVTIDQASQAGEWVSLGEYEFPTHYGAVELSDLVDDGSNPVAVLFDAVKWEEVTEPIEVNSYLDGFPDDSVFSPGQQVRFCYSVNRPTPIRWSWWTPTSGWRVVTDDENGSGECQLSDPLSGTGLRRVKIEALEGTRIVDFDEVRFTVADAATATPDAYASIRIKGGCGRTIDWGERFDYEFESSVRGLVSIYDCYPPDSLRAQCAFLQEQEVSPGEVMTGSYIGHTRAGDHQLEARLEGPGNRTGRCKYTVRAQVTLPTPTPTPKKVAVLVHGWLGLGSEGGGSKCTNVPTLYSENGNANEWGNISDALLRADYRVYFAHWETRRGFTSTIEDAGNCLFTQINWVKETEHVSTVTLIAHSMGGLVSRAYIESGNQKDDVDTLVTFGTPHLGVQLQALLNLLALTQSGRTLAGCRTDPGTCDLSLEAMRDFNDSHRLSPNTRYELVGGTWEWPASRNMFPMPHDGVVSLVSAVGLNVPRVNKFQVNDSHTELNLMEALGLSGPSYKTSDDGVACLRYILGLPGGTAVCANADKRPSSAQLAQADEASPQFTESFRGHISPGTTQAVDISIEGDHATIYVSSPGASLGVSLTSANDRSVTQENISSLYPGGQYARSSSVDGTLAVIVIPNAEPGIWRVTLQNNDPSPQSYFVFSALTSQLALGIDTQPHGPDSPFIDIRAHLSEWQSPISDVDVQLTVEGGGHARHMRMLEARTAGEYVATIPLPPQQVIMTITASGTSPSGRLFSRENSGTIQPSPSPLQRYWSILLPVAARAMPIGLQIAQPSNPVLSTPTATATPSAAHTQRPTPSSIPLTATAIWTHTPAATQPRPSSTPTEKVRRVTLLHMNTVQFEDGWTPHSVAASASHVFVSLGKTSSDDAYIRAFSVNTATYSLGKVSDLFVPRGALHGLKISGDILFGEGRNVNRIDVSNPVSMKFLASIAEWDLRDVEGSVLIGSRRTGRSEQGVAQGTTTVYRDVRLERPSPVTQLSIVPENILTDGTMFAVRGSASNYQQVSVSRLDGDGVVHSMPTFVLPASEHVLSILDFADGIVYAGSSATGHSTSSVCAISVQSDPPGALLWRTATSHDVSSITGAGEFAIASGHYWGPQASDNTSGITVVGPIRAGGSIASLHTLTINGRSPEIATVGDMILVRSYEIMSPGSTGVSRLDIYRLIIQE